jgi:orotate phosphoribosyltransferase
MSHASWISNLMTPSSLKEVGNWGAKIIDNKFPDVDYVVSVGLSGNLISPIVCMLTNKYPFVCRKSAEDTHSENTAEYKEVNKPNPTAVLIDDFISSGATIRYVYSILKENNIELVGILLHYEGNDLVKVFLYKGGKEIPIEIMGNDKFNYSKEIYLQES